MGGPRANPEASPPWFARRERHRNGGAIPGKGHPPFLCPPSPFFFTSPPPFARNPRNGHPPVCAQGGRRGDGPAPPPSLLGVCEPGAHANPEAAPPPPFGPKDGPRKGGGAQEWERGPPPPPF